MSDQPVLPAETHIGRTALRVADLGDLSDFYREVVGLTVLEESGATTTLGAGEDPLLVLERDDESLARHDDAAGLYHNAFRFPSREALAQAVARVREHWHVDGAADHAVSEAVYLTDPEGNGVELYHDRARDAWPRTADGHVNFTTDPLDVDGLVATVSTSDEDRTGAPAETDVGHVHLELSSLSAFEAFFVDTLGFEVTAKVPSAWFASAGGYHHHVAANTWHHRSLANEGRGLAWFEVVLPDESVLAAVSDRLAESAYDLTEVDGGVEVRGPDDVRVRLAVE